MGIKNKIAAPFVRAQAMIGYHRLKSFGHAQLLGAVPHNAVGPEWHDLWFLYKTVRKYRPHIVLEFGSGCSTPIIASALADNGLGKIYTVDAFADWLAVTRKYFPPKLLPHCEFIHSDAVKSEHDGRTVWRHLLLPEIVPDMIYLDGPPLTKAIPASVDVLDIEPKLKRGAVLVIDGRKENFAYLRAKLKRQWSFEWHRLGYRGFAILS